MARSQHGAVAIFAPGTNIPEAGIKLLTLLIDRAKEELKVRLNVIDEVCVRLAEEYGREETAEEVAEKMKMDPEDVRYLMKIALSAIKRD